MDVTMKRLGEAELEIMIAIWHSHKPVTSNYILEQIQGRRKWVLSTLMTSLTRLATKGFVYCDRTTRINMYSALITEDDYKTMESSSLLEKLYNNSLHSFVKSLYSSNSISDSDLLELRKFLEYIEQKKRGSYND